MKAIRNLLIIAALTLSVSGSASAQTPFFTDQEASCRDGLFSPAYLLTSVLLGEAGHCHRLRMAGRIDPSTDCNDAANALRPRRIARLEDHLRNRSVERCDNVGTPANMGYPATCPLPCASIAISDFNGVAECSICLAHNAARRMALDSIGMPPVTGPSPVLKCQSSISTALDFGTRKRMREQRVCQQIHDLGRTVSGVTDATDCETADLFGKVAKAELRARNAIAKCDPAAVAQLDSCNQTSVPAVQGCVENAVRRSVGEIYNFIYPSRVEPAPLQAFVTSDGFDGSDIGGISNADALCQNAALTAGLTGTFTAWLSSHNAGVAVSSPSTTFSNDGRGYERVDGVAIATSLSDLFDGTLLAPINVDELGATIDIDFQVVWTGTNIDGTPMNATMVSDQDNCDLWSGGGTGSTGRAHASNSTWTADDVLACNLTNRLYCFEQSN